MPSPAGVSGGGGWSPGVSTTKDTGSTKGKRESKWGSVEQESRFGAADEALKGTPATWQESTDAGESLRALRVLCGAYVNDKGSRVLDGVAGWGFRGRRLVVWWFYHDGHEEHEGGNGNRDGSPLSRNPDSEQPTRL